MSINVKKILQNIFILFFLFSVRPNIFMCARDDCAQYKKWYYEVVVEKAEPFVTAEPTHLRVGWASTEGYRPSPTGGHGWGSNGVGDDLCSYGFDGLQLWTGKVETKHMHYSSNVLIFFERLVLYPARMH